MHQSYQMKSLEEMQEDARKKNIEDADKLCKNICLCIGWSSILLGFCYLIIMIIVISLTDTEKSNSILIVEEAIISSNSN